MKLIIDIDEEDIKVVENTVFTVEELFETTNGRIYRAICKALLNKKTLADVLDKIRTGITDMPKLYPFVDHIDTYVKEDDVLAIIDKYRNEVSE